MKGQALNTRGVKDRFDCIYSPVVSVSLAECTLKPVTEAHSYTSSFLGAISVMIDTQVIE